MPYWCPYHGTVHPQLKLNTTIIIVLLLFIFFFGAGLLLLLFYFFFALLGPKTCPVCNTEVFKY